MSQAMAAAGLVLILGLAAESSNASQAPHAANPGAAAIARFQDRAKEYVELRNKVRSSLKAPKPSEDARDFTAEQQALAEGVRRARAGARAGDLFAPEVAPILRQAISEDLQERTPDERAAALKDVPHGLVLQVNDPYPKSMPLATVPPRLLAAMPRLPDGLEYRFVGRRVILYDIVTNLVVDILDEALPAR